MSVGSGQGPDFPRPVQKEQGVADKTKVETQQPRTIRQRVLTAINNLAFWRKTQSAQKVEQPNGDTKQEVLPPNGDAIAVIEGRLADMRSNYSPDSYIYKTEIPLYAQYLRKEGELIRGYVAENSDWASRYYPGGPEYQMGSSHIIATYDRGLVEAFLKAMGAEDKFATLQAIESQAVRPKPEASPGLGSAFRTPEMREWYLKEFVHTDVDGVVLEVSKTRRDPVYQSDGVYNVTLQFSKSAVEKIASSTPAAPKIPPPQYPI